MKKIALAIAGLLFATPSTFANVDEANMFQDLGYIKATCLYNKFNKVDKRTARRVLKKTRNIFTLGNSLLFTAHTTLKHQQMIAAVRVCVEDHKGLL